MYRYMNRFTYRVSTLSTQLITKLSKMNRFTVLESQNQLSTISLTGELDVVPCPALAVLRLAGVVAHVADLRGRAEFNAGAYTADVRTGDQMTIHFIDFILLTRLLKLTGLGKYF